MNTFLGIFWLLFLFGFCFFTVHLVRLARIGQRHLRQVQKPPEQKPPVKAEKEKEKTPAQEPAREPIYYIVERKRKSKSSFSEPKEIRFK